MVKRINILLLGAHINSSNLGCQALTYSLVDLLEKIAVDKGIKMEYFVIEYQPDEEVTAQFAKRIGLKSNHISSYKFPFILSWKNIIKQHSSIHMFRKLMNKVDIAIDITAGDSFADIYGNDRFLATTRIKEMIEKKGIPLVLGPQTYGPFNNVENEKFATEIIKNAYRVISRDIYSAEYVRKMTKRKIPITTDLAFQLPYTKRNIDADKIKIGINISGLLVERASEAGFVNKNSLKTDYDTYIDELLRYLISEEKYDIYLIPHVEEDVQACQFFDSKYQNTKLINMFSNPMDVKSFISGMDIFIGARMHATIAAFTSGVVTIPTAYSRKFETMFSVVKYNVVVDLQELDTKSALEKTRSYIEHYHELQKQVEESLNIANYYKKQTEDFFAEAILSLEVNHE